MTRATSEAQLTVLVLVVHGNGSNTQTADRSLSNAKAAALCAISLQLVGKNLTVEFLLVDWQREVCRMCCAPYIYFQVVDMPQANNDGCVRKQAKMVHEIPLKYEWGPPPHTHTYPCGAKI